MTVVAEEAPTTVVWPSSPAGGWLSGVNRMYGTPNGQKLLPLERPGYRIWASGNEFHGPYQHGDSYSYPAVNSDHYADPKAEFNPNIPAALGLKVVSGGLGQRSTFASEFGTVAMSSFESMSATLAPAHWGIHGRHPTSPCHDLPNQTPLTHTPSHIQVASRQIPARGVMGEHPAREIM
jgi:hypothetical protein